MYQSLLPSTCAYLINIRHTFTRYLIPLMSVFALSFNASVTLDTLTFPSCSVLLSVGTTAFRHRCRGTDVSHDPAPPSFVP